MHFPNVLKCDRCSTPVRVSSYREIEDQQGNGIVAALGCPICGEHEQWFAEPGSNVLGDDRPRSSVF